MADETRSLSLRDLIRDGLQSAGYDLAIAQQTGLYGIVESICEAALAQEDANALRAQEPPLDDVRVRMQPETVMAYRPVVVPVPAEPRVAQEPPQAQWQPIETFPKDGSWAIVYVADGTPVVQVARWEDTSYDCWNDVNENTRKMERVTEGYFAGCDGWPSHWKPLGDTPVPAERST